MPEPLAVRLRQARGELSVAEAASRAGIPEARIRMYEEGVRQPYGKTLRRLSEVYGTPVAELLPVAAAEVVAPPRPRRRRRRLPEESTHHVIEVPVDLRDGEPTRVTFELVVRPRQRPTPAPAPEPRSADRADARELRISPPQPPAENQPALTAFREAYENFRRAKR